MAAKGKSTDKKPHVEPPSVTGERNAASALTRAAEGPFDVAAAEPSRSPPALGAGGSWRVDALGIRAWGVGGVSGHGPEPPCLETGAFLSGVGSQGSPVAAGTTHPPAFLSAESWLPAPLTCLSPPLPAALLSKWREIKLTAPTGGSGWLLWGRGGRAWEAVNR